jgi:hypothetical protein
MSNPFNSKYDYPLQGKISDYFKEHFDAVFIAFSPFFRLPKQRNENRNAGNAPLTEHTHTEFPPYEIYYPTKKEIFEHTEAVSWAEVVEGSGLKDFAQLNRALETSIGALHPHFIIPDAKEKLDAFTNKEEIWHPSVDEFQTHSKMAMYDVFKLLGKNEIIVAEKSRQYGDLDLVLKLDNISVSEFIQNIGLSDYSVYSADKELLFKIAWDSFFFLIATDKEKMQIIIDSNLFEGFMCDDNTQSVWYFNQDEIDELLNLRTHQRKAEESLTIASTNLDPIETQLSKGKSFWQKIFRL